MRRWLERTGMAQNLSFLVLEVRRQLERTRDYLQDPDPAILDKINARDDYIDNLKGIIERKCFEGAAAVADDRAALVALKSVDVVAVNLERVADFCENVIRQYEHLTPEGRKALRVGEFFQAVLDGIGLVEPAIFDADVNRALELCRAEMDLDQAYKDEFAKRLSALEDGRTASDQVTGIFIAHYFERMGDALLNIGEAVISSSMGERIKIGQYWALEDTLDETTTGADEVTLEPAGETRSGCRIDLVHKRDGRDRELVFKEGRAQKLREERDSFARWEELMPGLTPKVQSYHERDGMAAMLLEFLTGRTFEDMLLGTDATLLHRGLDGLINLLLEIWRRTRREGDTAARFMAQTEKRLPDVFDMHPRFNDEPARIGDFPIPSFRQLLHRARELEEQWTAPFSVLTHGDLNVDNVIFDPRDGSIHMIDLHRSRDADYVQDVSVFLVSQQRLQALRNSSATLASETSERFLEFARKFARDHDDHTFEQRLGLGLARSFVTSTRFVLDKRFANSMFLRSRYLLERLVDQPADFRVLPEVLVV